MGLRDTEEMLEACQADAAQLERDLAHARTSLGVARAERLRLQQAMQRLRDLCDDADERQGAQTAPARIRVSAIRAIVGGAADLEHA